MDASQQNPTPAQPSDAGSGKPESSGPQMQRAREVGGRDGPEPTRFGDWEKSGRCIDF
jgi:hypothetical protein